MSVFFSGLQKKLAAAFFMVICASASFAAANDLELFAAPKDNVLRSNSGEVNGGCFTGYVIKFTVVSTAPDSKDMFVSPVGGCVEDAVSITLHKDGNTTIWSLAPVLSEYSLNPIEDIKNLQVLLLYRF